MSSSSGRDPMYGTMTTALINGAANKGSSSSSSSGSSGGILGAATGLSRMQLEHLLGASAVAGTGLFVWKIAMYAVRSGGRRGEDDEYDLDDDNDEINERQKRAARFSLMAIFRRFLRNLLLDDPEATRDAALLTDIEGPQRGDGAIITHQGSCHCESIRFEVLGPRCLTAKEGPGKIQYRHTQVKAAHFRVYVGHECLKTYYVFRGNARKGAHAFCERCGVHILFAPSKSTPLLNINVNCLIGNGISKVRVTSKKDNISEGFPADGQWDTSDQLSTISEVTQPFHFQISHQNHSDSGDWKQHYHRHNSSDLYSVGEGDTGDEEEDNYSAPIKKVSVPPVTSMSTPTTTSSSTMEAESSYTSQLAQLKMMAPHGGSSAVDDLTAEDMSLSDEASLSSARQKLLMGSSSSSLRRKSPGLPRTPTTASPELRNKMRYFMGKYKHASSEDKESQKSAGTATTTASSMTTDTR
mmetsp:Transcript_6703/g.11607  ORF Transcript_6703/g.11607 Transcript_6703/m.11607 type:complete len:469 (-) Transcript_6703:201-1607(-)